MFKDFQALDQKKVARIGLVLFFVAGGSVLLFQYNTIPNTSVPPEQTSTEAIEKEDTYTSLMQDVDFKKGEESLVNDPVEAIAAYEIVLSRTEGKEKEYVTDRLISAHFFSGDALGAVTLALNIVSDPTQSRINRADAIQGIARIYSAYVGDTKLTEPIFSHELLQRAFDTDRGVSTRKLYELATEIYPLAYAEYEIARWYARELWYGSATTTDMRDAYYAKIQEHISKGDSDVTRMEQYSGPQFGIPSALMRKAETLAYLEEVGMANPDTVGAEAVYVKALGKARELGAIYNETSIRFRYAAYLAERQGVERLPEIKELLAEIYTSSAYANTILVKEYFSDRVKMLREIQIYTEALVAVDTDFKNYLVSRGWVF